MKNETHTALVPFSSETPLVPGKGGSLRHWRLERDKQQLRDQALDLAKALRRLAEELVDELLFLRDPTPKTPEAIARRMSQIAGALKRDGGALRSLFELADIHPALQKLFSEKPPDNFESLTTETFIDLPAPIVEPEKKPTLRYMLSNREFEILTLLLAGESPKEVAAKLKITRSTVHNTMARIKLKAKQIVKDGAKHEPNGQAI